MPEFVAGYYFSCLNQQKIEDVFKNFLPCNCQSVLADSFKTISCSAPTCPIVIFHEKCITGKIKAGWMCLSCTTEKKKIEAKRKSQLKLFPENITVSTETAGHLPVPPTLPSTSATVSGTPTTTVDL